MLINGEWLKPDDNKCFWSTNPATSDQLARVVDGGADHATLAIDAAASAFPAWSATTAYQRAELLGKARENVLARAADIVRLMSEEQGKPLRAALTEVRYAADFLG